MIKKKTSKKTGQGGRHHSHSSLAYTKRRPSDSDSSATDDPTQPKNTPKRPLGQIQSPLPPKVRVVDSAEGNSEANKPQLKQPLNRGGTEAQGEEMKKRRAEYSLEVGISSDSGFPGSTYKRERTKRFSIKRKSVINPVDLTSTSVSQISDHSQQPAAPVAEGGEHKKAAKRDEEKVQKKEKNKRRKTVVENRKKRSKNALNTPFKMVHEVIRNAFKKKIAPACSKAPNVLRVFKTALDRYQNILFYEVTSQPKIMTSQPQDLSKSPQINNSISNNEKIQLLLNGIECYKKEIEQWNNVIKEYDIENDGSIKEINKSSNSDSIKSKKDVSLLLPSFKERAGYSDNDDCGINTSTDKSKNDDDDDGDGIIIINDNNTTAAKSFTEEQDREIKNLVLSVDNLFPKIDAIQRSLSFAEQALPELSVRVRDYMIGATLDSVKPPSMLENGATGSGGGNGSLFSSSLIPSYNQI